MNSLAAQCQLYLDSFPGENGMSSNTAFHGMMRALLSGEYDKNEEALELISTKVNYRNNLTAAATDLLTKAEIARPKDLACSQFEYEAFRLFLKKQSNKGLRDRYTVALSMLRGSRIFGRPDYEQGQPFSKPYQYLAAAVALDGTIKDDTQAFKQAVQRLDEGMYTRPCFILGILLTMTFQLTRSTLSTRSRL
jgi:hypothetical protein